MLKRILLAATLSTFSTLGFSDAPRPATLLAKAEEAYESIATNPAAINTLISQADTNNPYASFYTGVAYALGRWIERDFDAALPYFISTSDRIPESALNAGILYYLKAQIDSAMPYLVVAGGGEKLDGIPQAMVLLGRIYERGEGGAGKNYVAAWRWYEAASRRKDIEATAKLGEFSLYGLGRSPDVKSGKIYLERAAGQWNLSAQRHLYDMHAKGIGVGVNRTEAAKWAFIQLSHVNEKQKASILFPVGMTDQERTTAQSMADLWIVAHPKYPSVNYLAISDKVGR